MLGQDGRIREHIRGEGAAPAPRLATPLDALTPRAPSLAILTPCFFPPRAAAPEWSQCLWGGGERYLVDLSHLFKDLGYDVHLFQPSAEPYEIDVHGVAMHGLGVWGWGPFEFQHRVSQEFTALARRSGFSRLCYLNLDVATAAPKDALVLTHGVWWDQVAGPWRGQWNDWVKTIRKAHEAGRLLVSVDTNGINWARSVLGQDVADRMRYLPNYADEALYPAARAAIAPGHRGADGRMRVLFPRRLVPSRGTGLMLDIAEQLLREQPGAALRFAGKGVPGYAQRISALAKRHPGRVSRSVLQMDGMEDEYLQADVAVIPTLQCEGTSLSCIEAMAAGCAIVTTHVGGLGNLVLDGWNGRLVEPTPEAVRSAIAELLADPERAAELGARARQTFEASFTMARWRDRWMGVLRELGWIGEDGAALAA